MPEKPTIVGLLHEIRQRARWDVNTGGRHWIVIYDEHGQEVAYLDGMGEYGAVDDIVRGWRAVCELQRLVDAGEIHFHDLVLAAAEVAKWQAK